MRRLQPGALGLRILIVALVGVVESGCGLSFAEKRTVDAWLNCGDCREGQLARVDSLAAREEGDVVDYLAASLNGPPAEQQENVAQQFAESWRRIGQNSNPPITEADYIRTNLDNYRAGVQLRSARALARIGTPEAMQVLGDALAADSVEGRFRGDVRAYVATLVTETTLPPIGIGLVPSGADYGDIVSLTTPLGLGISASASVRLEGAPFGENLAVGIWPDSIRARVLALPGRYYFVVRDPATGVHARSDSVLTVERVSYLPRSFSQADTLRADSAAFAALSGWISDTTGRPQAGRPADHYRVAENDTTVLAIVRWSGPGRFEAVWQQLRCDSLVHAADSTVSGTILTDAGHPLPGARVEVGHGPSRFTNEEGHFHLPELTAGSMVDLLVSVEGGPPSVHPVEVGSNELLLIHHSTVAPPPLTARADTVEAYFDGGECKTLRVVRTDRLGTTLLARTELSLVPTVVTVLSSAGNAISLRVGQQRQLDAVVMGTIADLPGRHYHWFSSNPSVASVTADGRVRGVSAGNATVKVATSFRRWSIAVTVNP